MSRKRWNEEKLIRMLKTFDGNPTVGDAGERYGSSFVEACRYYFGSWNKAKEGVGLEITPSGRRTRKHSDEEIIGTVYKIRATTIRGLAERLGYTINKYNNTSPALLRRLSNLWADGWLSRWQIWYPKSGMPHPNELICGVSAGQDVYYADEQGLYDWLGRAIRDGLTEGQQEALIAMLRRDLIDVERVREMKGWRSPKKGWE